MHKLFETVLDDMPLMLGTFDTPHLTDLQLQQFRDRILEEKKSTFTDPDQQIASDLLDVSTNDELESLAQHFAATLIGTAERTEQLGFSRTIAPCLDTDAKNMANRGVNSLAVFSCM